MHRPFNNLCSSPNAELQTVAFLQHFPNLNGCGTDILQVDGAEMAGLDIDLRVASRVKQARRLHPAMTEQHVAAFLESTVEEFQRIEDGAVRLTGEQLLLLSDLMQVAPSWFFID